MKRNKWFLLIAAVCILLFSSCDLILGLFAAKGIVTGIVYDAGTNSVVAGVTVTVVGSSESTVTDTFGEFELEVSEGTQTLHFTKTGYTFYDITVVVVADITVELDESVVGYDPLSSNEYRIVLTWGENPRDLDSHLRLPNLDTVDYNNETADDSSANLDWDDTQSFGPETITITTQNAGTYYYSVHNYAGTGTIGTSSAVVKVYNYSGLWRTYTVSQITGDSSKRYWRVFSLNGSNITALNTYADSAW